MASWAGLWGAHGARSMTRLTSVHPRDRELFHCAAHGVPEVDLELVFQVAARFMFWFRRHAAAPAKELAEEVAKARSSGPGTRASAKIEAPKIKIHAGVARALVSAGIASRRQVLAVEAVLVVHLPLLGVGEHVVGLLDLLEFFFRGFVAGIQVGVVFARHLAEGRADILHAGLARHSQEFVIILFCRCWHLLCVFSLQLSVFGQTEDAIVPSASVFSLPFFSLPLDAALGNRNV